MSDVTLFPPRTRNSSGIKAEFSGFTIESFGLDLFPCEEDFDNEEAFGFVPETGVVADLTRGVAPFVAAWNSSSMGLQLLFCRRCAR